MGHFWFPGSSADQQERHSHPEKDNLEGSGRFPSRTMLGKLHDHLDRSDIDGNEEFVLFEGSAIFQKFNVFFPF